MKYVLSFCLSLSLCPILHGMEIALYMKLNLKLLFSNIDNKKSTKKSGTKRVATTLFNDTFLPLINNNEKIEKKDILVFAHALKKHKSPLLSLKDVFATIEQYKIVVKRTYDHDFNKFFLDTTLPILFENYNFENIFTHIKHGKKHQQTFLNNGLSDYLLMNFYIYRCNLPRKLLPINIGKQFLKNYLDTRLHQAIKWENFDSIQKIILEKADVNSIVDEQSSLVKALMYQKMNYETIIKYLLNHRADPNLKTTQGGTPLCYILPYMFHTMLYLLDNKADPNIADQNGQTLLHKTFSHSIIKTLLKHKANPTLKDKNGLPSINYTTLQTMLYSNNDRELIEKLIAETPIDITEKIQGNNLLDYEQQKKKNDNRILNLHRIRWFDGEKDKIFIFLVYSKLLEQKIKQKVPKPILKKILITHAKIPAFGTSVPFFSLENNSPCPKSDGFL